MADHVRIELFEFQSKKYNYPKKAVGIDWLLERINATILAGLKKRGAISQSALWIKIIQSLGLKCHQIERGLSFDTWNGSQMECRDKIRERFKELGIDFSEGLSPAGIFAHIYISTRTDNLEKLKSLI